MNRGTNAAILFRCKWAVIFLGLAIVIAAVALPATIAVAQPDKQTPLPENHAKGAALIDVESGRLLYSKRGDDRMLIASLTKIMTAIVAIEHGRLDSTVQVSIQAAGKEGSSLYLQAGEKMKLRDMLYGLMLRSGNDAAVAIAEHVGGSVPGFVFLMNRKADELGLANSHFANPSGLDEPGHYSSANDLAKLAAYALHHPIFRDIVKTRVKTAPNPNEQWDYKWVNKNKMLAMYEGADGVKTGYTKQALRTLVSSATRGGQQLVAVTLNDGDDWSDHRRMLDYGFAGFPLTTIAEKGEPVKNYPYRLGESFRYPLAPGEREKLEFVLAENDRKSADRLFGREARLRFVLDGKEVGSVPLEQRHVEGAVLEEEDGEPFKEAVTSSTARGPKSFREALRASVLGLLL